MVWKACQLRPDPQGLERGFPRLELERMVREGVPIMGGKPVRGPPRCPNHPSPAAEVPYSRPDGVPPMMDPKRGRPLRGAACPGRGGRLFPGAKPFRRREILLGTFPVQECGRCGDYFFTARGWSAAETAARERGEFGIASEETARHPTNGPARNRE